MDEGSLLTIGLLAILWPVIGAFMFGWLTMWALSIWFQVNYLQAVGVTFLVFILMPSKVSID